MLRFGVLLLFIGLQAVFAAMPPPKPAVPMAKLEPADTIKTTTTTTLAPVPPPPAPPVPPHLPPFVVQDNLTHVTCLLANLTATVKVSWNNTLNNTKAHREFVYNVTTAVEDSRSLCRPFYNVSDLGLTHLHEQQSSLLLEFANTSKSQYGLTFVTLQLKLDPVHYDGVDSRVMGLLILKAENLTLWQTTAGSYYECMVGSDTVHFKFANSNITDAVVKVELEFDAVKVQALMTRDDKNMFGKASVCVTDRVTSEIVPIVVGCALAALVIIVLAAYLIGRRRSRARGYESM